VPPEQLFPAFEAALAVLEKTGGLQAFQRLGGHVLIALDGTEDFRSNKIHCRACSRRARGDDQVEWFHTLLAATLVAPGHDRVVPLPPVFVAPQDGHAKQDGESRAGRRGTAASWRGWRRSISATTSMPASRSASRPSPAAATSCSWPSRPRTQPWPRT
jgi:hypothetical protein